MKYSLNEIKSRLYTTEENSSEFENIEYKLSKLKHREKKRLKKLSRGLITCETICNLTFI